MFIVIKEHSQFLLKDNLIVGFDLLHNKYSNLEYCQPFALEINGRFTLILRF